MNNNENIPENTHKKRKTEPKTFQSRMVYIKTSLFIEILFTIGIAAAVIANVSSGLYQEARQTTTEAKSDFVTIMDGYAATFSTMVIPIEEKIEEDVSFDEMQQWLYGKEQQFSDAMGADVYDGIALTYKGGYAHSWDYGDYSDYDPNTRPWYQQAQKADGAVTIVTPYVTYLNAANINDDEYILMSIAQKYNEEISFDLDLKVLDIKSMLANTSLIYPSEKIFIYDKEGYILSTTDTEGFAHNVYTSDEIISEEYAEAFREYGTQYDELQLKYIDGHFQYIYFNADDQGNTVCMIIPFGEVCKKNFLVVGIISILLIMFEIYLFAMNRRNAIEFLERDKRLRVVSDKVYKERLYVDVDSMDFYGNDMAGELCRNGTYEELYGLIQSRMLKKEELPRLEEFLSPQVLKGTVNHQYVIDGERFMMKMQDADGTMRNKTIEISRLAFTRNRKHMVGISMQDAAESADLLKEALESANQASQSKGNFLSNMSHEIRTPLNAMIGYLTIARDEQCTPEKKNYCIENCEVASRHLLEIINDILDMSSIESGKLKIAHEEFDLKKEIADLTTIFFQNAKIKNVEFETHVENLTEEWVVGDQLRVNQVLMNLLSNAVKFTPEHGRVQLKVSQLRTDEKQVYMKFEVTDTGIGMSEEYMSRIFHPFEQESAGTAKKFGGSGLGLSITNNLVHMMGGNIQVQSVQNQGTCFTVTMFFQRSHEQHEQKVPVDYSHVRVLVVDDKEDECTYVKTMLKRCGVEADVAGSGERALRQIRRRKGGDFAYDLCIIDWNMPSMNGGEVTRRIREELGEKMPIVIATAYDITEFEDEAREAGADKIIAKPLFQSTLFDLLVSTFGKYDPAKEHVGKQEMVDMAGIHILLAEDNPMNMDIAVTLLEKTGITVDQATNGQEAVDKFLASEPGCYNMILMDVQMPIMDGYEATGQIRGSSHPEAQCIPIIAMTANAFAEDVAEALSKGMNAHIAKPINYDKLFGLVEKFADTKQTGQKED